MRRTLYSIAFFMALLLVIAIPVHAQGAGDSTAPSIGIPSVSPASPGSGASVTVSVDVNDTGSGVASVSIVYSTDNWASSNNTVSAPYVPTSDNYQGTIPAQSQGSYVSYYVVALDAAGNRAVNNNSGGFFAYDVTGGFGGGIGGFNITNTSMWIIAAILGAIMVAMVVVMKRRSGSKKSAGT